MGTITYMNYINYLKYASIFKASFFIPVLCAMCSACRTKNFTLRVHTIPERLPVFNPGPTIYINKGTKSYTDPLCLVFLYFVS